MPSTGAAGDSARTSNEIVTDLLSIVRDLMAYTGGEYTYFDKTPFDPADTSGYTSETCGDQAGQSINVNVAGPPAADIEVVEQKVVDAYTARGWEVILRQTTELPEGKMMDVSFAEPTGKEFSFGLGPNGTAIIVESECSTHPSLDEPST